MRRPAVRQHLAGAVGDDRVAALERRERAQRLQPARRELEALLRALDLPQQSAAQIALRRAKTLADPREAMRRARVRDRGRKPREAQLARLEAALDGALELRLELVEACALAQLHVRAAALQAVRKHAQVPSARR